MVALDDDDGWGLRIGQDIVDHFQDCTVCIQDGVGISGLVVSRELSDHKSIFVSMDLRGQSCHPACIHMAGGE